MKTISLKKTDLNPKDWIRKRAKLEHGSQVLRSDVQVFDEATGAHVLTFQRVPEATIPVGPLFSAVSSIPYDRAYRTSGLLSHSKTFGFQPRIPIRRDYCALAGLATSHPAQHETLMRYGELASDLYAATLPDEWAAQMSGLNLAIKQGHWRRAHFTSGIVNDKNVLAYHRDQGNFPDMLSTMFIISRDMHGTNGRLVLPEYDAALEFDGFEMLTFSGANVIHGVTPINISSRGATRYTIVYYPLKGLAACGTPDEELERIKRVKTQREEQRHSARRAELASKVAQGKTEEELYAAGERKRALFERTKRGGK